jgi:hypothetical protein
MLDRNFRLIQTKNLAVCLQTFIQHVRPVQTQKVGTSRDLLRAAVGRTVGAKQRATNRLLRLRHAESLPCGIRNHDELGTLYYNYIITA